MIYIVLYAISLTTVFIIIFRKQVSFCIRLMRCKRHNVSTLRIYIERSIDDKEYIVQELTNKTIMFSACLSRNKLETELFFERLDKTKIYILRGHMFYYPFKARDTDGETHKDLRGVYSENRGWLIVTEDLSAYTWELKNLWNKSCGDSNLHDPNPSDIGLENCI